MAAMSRIAFVRPLVALVLAGASSSFQDPGAPPQEGAARERPVEEDLPRGLLRSETGAFQGYTLVSPLASKVVYLLDMQGEVVHRWETQYPPSAVYLLPNGNLLRTGRVDENEVFRGGGICGQLQEIDWDGKVVWDYRMADEYRTSHHDVEPLPNGNVLLIAWEHRFREDAIAWGRDPEHVGEDGFWPDAVYEVKPIRPEGGEIVWEWHVWDHVVQDLDPEQQNHGDVSQHPGKVDINADHRDRPPITEEERREREELERQMRALGYVGGVDDAPRVIREGHAPDWLHTNAIDYHPEHDLIVLSTPHLCELWVIDHSTTTEEAAWGSGGRWGKGGELLWRWGNPRNYGHGDDPDRQLFYQHDAQWIAGEKPGELRLTVFNNGGGRPGGDHSSVDELVLPFDPEKGFLREPGLPFGPSQPAWSYTDPPAFFSAFISGAQRLPNGNTLICEGAEGRVFEVTRAGEIVWDWRNPFEAEVKSPGRGGNAPPHALFRATRIAADDPALQGRL